ncbi:MAG: hypothetical protein COX80_02810 [Candidatus Magasanikbacteria bacterium CG_4_10_14_0_2_um_filter_33_14]|uniref:Uncharacterized protein n=1 Tax=Candidatus Magasanikbacteria bacterium CG_4_10_14_0_2_um_filter_33_14 TaxID=1974636 RepID=A0A2M7VAY6_9BACT|nr:MAG: hypothetical protein COX80_02810 [Candidatus Magasanikbacteria bacterium CG_4_10_14_0_2_um_filter_33_14]
MDKIYYPNQKIHNKILLWIQRIFSLIFLYATLTLPTGLKLMDTPLVTTIRKEYPTWWHVAWDIVLTIFILGIIIFVIKLFLLYTKKHHTSQKYINWLKKMDGKFIQNFLNFDFFVIKFILATILSLVIWQILKQVLQYFPIFHLPQYSTQPVVFVMVILGLIIFVESFESWKNKIRKHLHITERF